MQFLRNLPIGGRIALIATFPMLAAAALAFGSLSSNWNSLKTSENIEQQVGTAQKISALVHELQKERGMSAGYIGSEGREFADRLPEQRRVTDRALASLDAEAQSNEELAHALEIFSDIKLTRNRTSTREASVGEVARFYTAGIGRLLSVMGSGGRNSADMAIVDALDAYIAISLAKEKAGLERAMGATGFGAGEFAPEVYDRFVGLRAQQEVHLERFNLHADDQSKGELARVLAAEASQAVFSMRSEARIGRLAPGSVDAEAWWDSITGKIDGLRGVEIGAGGKLAEVAALDRARSSQILLANAALFIVLGALTIAATVVVVMSITRPVRALGSATDRMAKGALDTEIGVAETRDEIGSLAASIRVFREQLINAEVERERHATERERNLSMVETRSRKVDELTRQFHADMDGAMGVFAHSVETLMVTAEELDRRASEASQRSTLVASASQQTNTNVQIVASATEELSLSIEEIVGQVTRSSQHVAEAARQAQSANTDMQALDGAAREIDDAVRLIADIAEQTNVLALNATIEAARAGAGGAGFAVVASEVRVLAEQTADATKKIAAIVGQVVEKSDRASRGMDQISDMILRVEQASTAMSAALEQQGAAAQNIAQSVHEAAAGVGQVDANITEIQQSSSDASERVKSVIDAATQFSDRAGSVRGSVDRFLTSIKAA